jgi:hypothetical protein
MRLKTLKLITAQGVHVIDVEVSAVVDLPVKSAT